jgi:glyoxylase-like metal-dependent hydrolase (beta-lactamase superfamily II)
VEIRSGGARALLIGDAMHSPIQCAAPDSRPALDTPEFAQAARDRRRAILADVAETDTVVAGSHFPPPGFGRVLRDGDAYRFEPVGGRQA